MAEPRTSIRRTSRCIIVVVRVVLCAAGGHVVVLSEMWVGPTGQRLTAVITPSEVLVCVCACGTTVTLT